MPVAKEEPKPVERAKPIDKPKKDDIVEKIKKIPHKTEYIEKEKIELFFFNQFYRNISIPGRRDDKSLPF